MRSLPVLEQLARCRPPVPKSLLRPVGFPLSCLGLGAFVFMWLASPAPCRAARDGERFRDDFNGSMDGGWTWVRENPATWHLTSTSLQIELERGDLWSNWTNNCKNMLLRAAPSGDFTIEAHLTAYLVANINQALILLYADDDNYLRYGLLNLSGSIYVNNVHEVGAVPRPQTHTYYGSNDVYLRMSRFS